MTIVGTTTRAIPTLEEVLAQLHRILSSDAMRRSSRLKRFLSYIVHETLAGRADELKEYSIGMVAFDKGESFDPRLDPVVRVEAMRLRSRLAHYYLEQAGPDEIVIEVPKGSYAAAFSAAKEVQPRESAGRLNLKMSSNLVLAMPASGYRRGSELEDFCTGLNGQIIGMLSELETAHPKVASIAVTGSARKCPSGIRLMIHLIDHETGHYLGSMSIYNNLTNASAAQAEIAKMVAKRVESFSRSSPGKSGKHPAHPLDIKRRRRHRSSMQRVEFVRYQAAASCSDLHS